MRSLNRSQWFCWWSPSSLFVITATVLFLFFQKSVYGQTLRVDPLPVGSRPIGADVTATPDRVLAAVANSGAGSVSLLELRYDNDLETTLVTATSTVSQVPAPYTLSACRSAEDYGFGERVLVTSPQNNSVSVIDVLQGTIKGTIAVGPQPYSAACYWDGSQLKAVVSNLGNSTLSVLNLDSFSVTGTISDVPGSRGVCAIAVYKTQQGHFIAWVAGTEANVITLVDLTTSQILTHLTVGRPTVIRGGNGCCLVASAQDSTIRSYDPITLAVSLSFSNVPESQDVINSGLGLFATIGAQNSLWRRSGNPPVFEILPGFPNPAGLAAYSWTISVRPATSIVLVASTDSNAVLLVRAPFRLPSQFNISNGASFGTTQVAVGELSSLFATTGASQNIYAATIPLPRTLGGVTLKIGGSLNFDSTTGNWDYSPTGSVDAALHFVGPSQVNFQIPPGAPLGDSVPAQLTKPDGSTLLTTVRITATAPGLFSVLMTGLGQAAVLNQNNSQNFGTNPATRGSVIQIFATGGGATTPALLPGEAAPSSGNPLVQTNVQPTVTIGGVNATVKFSGMAPGWVGLWQINAEVPASVTPGNAVPLVVTSGSVPSNTVTIAVQ